MYGYTVAFIELFKGRKKRTIMRLSTLLLFLVLVTCVEAKSKIWCPSWMPLRHDLRCDSSCENYHLQGFEDIDDCCTCRSHSVWPSAAKPLHLEIITTSGKNLLVYEDANGTVQDSSIHENQTFPGRPCSLKTITNHTVYKIEYPNQQIKEFSSNLCNWEPDARLRERYPKQFLDYESLFEYIVKIDLSHNAISKVIDLNCLARLDTLNLSYNLIASLSNTSFGNLGYLRELDLMNNRIHHMEPNIILASRLRLQIVDISNNKLGDLDVTNMFSLKPFCKIRYNHNYALKSFVNVLGFELEIGKRYGPGFVELRNSGLQTLPDLKELFQLESLSQIGSLINFANFDLRGIPLICDCNIAPFMSLAIGSLWLDYFDVRCVEPEHMKNMSVEAFIDIGNLDSLTCDLSGDPRCPDRCKCIDQPSRDRIIINCSDTEMKELPDILPVSKFSSSYSLDVSLNDITSLKYASYLKDITDMSLANNNLINVDGDLIHELENATMLDFSNNANLRRLPSVLKYRNTRSIVLTNNIIDCDCESLWIQHWEPATDMTFHCRVPDHGVMSPLSFSKDMLVCHESSNVAIVLSILLTITLLFLATASLLSYWFRYELLIILLRVRQSFSRKGVSPELTYDVYLSYDVDNDDLRMWIHMTLVPHLERARYKVFVPFRDLKLGDVRHLNTIEILNSTRNFLLILSESCIHEKQHGTWFEQEWKVGWNMFKADRTRNIVMINFDQILASETSHRHIKAFIRVGGSVDFVSIGRSKTILGQVCAKLGPSRSTFVQEDQAWKIKKIDFPNRSGLFRGGLQKY